MNQQSLIAAGASVPDEAKDPIRLIARVIWNIVARDSVPGVRALFLLDGMPGSVLTALSELGSEGYFQACQYKLAIDAAIEGLDLSRVQATDCHDAPPVRVRNEDFPGPVLLAARESERRNARSSLNQVTVVEVASVADETDLWVDAFFGVGARRRAPELEEWVKAMIEGTVAAGFASDLERFAAVVAEVAADKGGLPRSGFMDAVYHLHLPRGSVDNIPAQGGKTVSAKMFESALIEAKRVAGNAPMLFDKDGKRYDLALVRQSIEDERAKGASATKGLTPSILEAVEALIDDEENINEAEWRPSQEAFCKGFDWNFADVILSNLKRPSPPKLHERVKNLMLDEGRDDAVERLKEAFDKFETGDAKERPMAAAVIFEDQGEWMIGNDPKLAKKLRAYAKTDLIVCTTDLSAGLLEAYQKLMASATDEIEGAEEYGDKWSVVLTAPRKDISSNWSSLSPPVYETFLLEMAFVEQVFSDNFTFDLGKWRKAVPNPDAKPKEKIVDLQLELRVEGQEKAAQIVRLDWTPSDTSLAVAMPDDLRQLYRNFSGAFQARVWPASAIVSSSTTSDGVSLDDLNSFELTENDCGITVASVAEEVDIFDRLITAMTDAKSGTSVDPAEAEAALQALRAFRALFSNLIESMQQLGKTPLNLGLIDRVATSYGDLCRAVAPFARTEQARDAVIVPICEFGLVKLQDEQAAILPAWHPIRLYERRVKFGRMAEIAGEVLREHGQMEGHGNEAKRIKIIADEHRLPGALFIDKKPYQVVDSLMGYGLAVSEHHEKSNRTSLEGSAEMASWTFLGVVDDYLELNPHEEASLSTAIYGAESTRLPRLLTDGIETRMKSNRNLRCELFITHDREQQLRDIYTVQNAILKERGTAGDGGFLSRLRVGVLPTENRSSHGGDRADIDVVLLHDAYQGISQIDWILDSGSADDMPDAADLDDWFAPRLPEFNEGPGDDRRLTMALGVSRPPRLIGHYMNLCFLAQRNNTQIENGKHARPVRTATWRKDDNRIGEVGHIVESAHDLGEWVVSIDRMSTRAMLQSFGIEVIRDIPARASEHRILVSASKPSDALRRRITQRFQLFHGLRLLDEALEQADSSIATVVRVAGQKLLGANRSTNAANEIIGLAAAARLVEGELLRSCRAETPVWISLDEAKAVFEMTGLIADAVALTVDLECHRPKLNMVVVEAKCVETVGVTKEAIKSREQTVSSVKDLVEHLVQNEDAADKRCRCCDILHMMAAKPEFRAAFPTAEARGRFVEAMLRGGVDVEVRGLSVVVAHDASDDQIASREIDFSDDASAPSQQLILSKRELSELLTEGTSPLDLTQHFSWEKVPMSAVALWRSENGRGPVDAPPDTTRSDSPGSSSSEATFKRQLDEEGSKAEEAAAPRDTNLNTLTAFPAAVAVFIAEAAQRPQAREDAEAINVEADRMANAIQDALIQYGMEARFHEEPFTITPNGTLVRFKGHKTLTERSLRAKLSELHTTHGINVVYLRPGKGWLGLFVSAERRRTVHLANLWMEATWPETTPVSNASILLGGREDDGRPLWLNLDGDHDGQPEHAPHTLIAGETGSGKGNLLQSMLLQLAATNDPKNLSIKLIDPKQGADFFWLEPVPHMDGEIVATPGEAVKTLKELVIEMNRRYDLIVGAKTRNINGYNRKVSETDRLPRIVVAHDEMASWMQGDEDYRKAVEAALTDLASKSRAAGIHIILITQRASQEAIPPSVRENMGNRLCLKVASDKGSKLALGVDGAEDLLGKGHLAAGLPGDAPSGSDFYIAQVPFISEDDLVEMGELIGRSWVR